MNALSSYLPTIILFMATAATFMMVVLVAMPFLQQDQTKSRLKIVTKRREELQAQQRARLQNEKKKSVVSESQIGMMKKVVEALNMKVAGSNSTHEIKNNLANSICCGVYLFQRNENSEQGRKNCHLNCRFFHC